MSSSSARRAPYRQHGAARRRFSFAAGGERFLVDCGEGTQRQLLRSSVGLLDLPDVLLTHYHADHFLGLPGLLKTLALRGRDVPLTVAGPVGLKEIFHAMRRVIGRLPYELTLDELTAGESIVRGDYRVDVFAVEHGVDAVGYAFVEDARPGRFDVDAARALGVPEGRMWGSLQRGEAVELDGGRTVTPSEVLGNAREGRRVVITGDTRPARSVIEAAYEAQVLVHDGTFSEEEADRAVATGHSTAREAAEIARFAGVELLALVHLSSRYGGSEIASEARELFGETVVPRDFDLIEVPYPERGRPSLIRRGARADAARPPEAGPPHGAPPALEVESTTGP